MRNCEIVKKANLMPQKVNFYVLTCPGFVIRNSQFVI